MLKRIGAEKIGEFKAIASGTVSSGKPVIVNSDGTVSLPESVTGGNGTPNTFSGGNNANHNGMSEVGNSKFVIAYRDSGNSNHGTAVVATGSGTTLSYGTPVVFDNQDCRENVVVYDSSTDRVAIFYYGVGDDKGYAIVGTVSGTSISFGTRVEIEPTEIGDGSGVFDPVNNKVVFFYKDVGNSNYGTYVIGTVSGTSISFTTPVVWHSATTRQCAAVYDTTNNKMAVAYRDVGDSSKGKMFIIDPGASSLTFGSEQTFHSLTSYPHELVEDTVNGKLIIFYAEASQAGAARVITVDGANKTISAGSELVYEAGSTDTTGSAAYNTLAGKAQSMCKDQGDSNKAKLYLFTVSGTSITLDSTTVIDTNGCERFAGDFSPSLGASVFVYTDEGASQGEAFVTKLGYNTLTSENYIGMSRGVVFQTTITQSAGTPVTFNSGSPRVTNIAYDTNTNRVVIVYRDDGNSGHGTAVVGTVSGTSISFGSEVVFNAAETKFPTVSYDTNAQKVLVTYQDEGNSNYGTAIVGTVDSSDNSISFGSETVFKSAATSDQASVYDPDSQKIIITFSVGSAQPQAAVATISGTSVSFGSLANFGGSNDKGLAMAYDTNADKVVVSYRDGSDTQGKASVGTVSGTSISFGSEATFESGGIDEYQDIAYDASAQKVVIAYLAPSNVGKAIVGTVSGTDITFGTAATYDTVASDHNAIAYDSTAESVAIFYRDTTPFHGKAVSGKVSGTSITFTDQTTFQSSRAERIAAVYDPDAQKVIVSYFDYDASTGDAVVFTTGYTSTTRGQIADGGNASMDIIGSVSDNQIGLTTGQQYFVQTDGTISTTADSPSVLAGTAISATELVVKT